MSSNGPVKRLNQYFMAKGVEILPRDLYANLRVAPVNLYGQRALAGTTALESVTNETGNPEEILTGAAWVVMATSVRSSASRWY